MTTNYSLAAKITRPNMSGTVTRSRLVTLLDAGKDQPITWISSPAGSGKTTLAADYLDKRKIPCLWYQLDEGDADVATFFYYLGMAAKIAAPRSRAPLPLLTPEYRQGLGAFTRRFFEKLFARLKPPFVLVFDNYQEVSPDSLIHEVVNTAAAIMPAGARIYVLSRNDPPPAFIRLRANGSMRIVGWNEVRFTREETKQLFRHSEKWKPSESVLEELHGKTEGWAAGLVLLMERVRTENVPANCSGRHLSPEVFNYFTGEVFDKLDSETRDFLLMTSFLPAMTERMAEKMTDQDHACGILSELNRNNFFTEKHQTAEPTYQYHALFREFLLVRMKESLSREGLLRMQNRAGAILEEVGRIEDAAASYREANNWERYIPLLLGHAQALITQGRSATLSAWLAAVPKEIGENIPWLHYWTGACTLLLNPVESQLCFEQAFKLFKKKDDVAGQFLAWSGIADSIFLAGFDYALLDPWLETLDELLKRHPDFPSQEIEIIVSNSVIGALLCRRPQQALLALWEKRASRLLPAIAEDRLRVTLGAHLLNYYIWFGDLAKASQLMDRLQSRGRSRSAQPLALLLFHNLEAVYYWVSADFEHCHETVAQALKTAELTGVHILGELLLSQGVYAALLTGDVARGAELLAQIKPKPGVTRRFDTAHYHYLAGWEAALRNDLSRALEHAQEAVSLTEIAGLPIPQAQSHIALTQVFILLKRYSDASRSITAVRRIIDDIECRHFEFASLLPEAWLAMEQNDDKKCIALLTAAFALGREKGWVIFPSWLPIVMSKLCAMALEAGIEVDYVKALIRKRGLLPPDLDAESNPQSAIRKLQLNNWPWPLKIHTLGRFELIRDGEPMRFTGKVQQKPLALLKALIAFGGKDVAEEHITDLLWPDADGDLAHKSFEMTVQRLRRLLGNDKVIQLQERRVSLDAGLCWIDVRELETLIEKVDDLCTGRSLHDLPSEAAQLSEKALTLYKGHFLPADSAHAWVLSCRERLRSKFLRLVTRLGRHREQTLQWDEAAEVFQRGLEVDVHAEEFYQRLMSCYHRLGRRAEAIAVYSRCSALLSSTLGISPSPRTEELYQSIIKTQ